MFILSWGTQRLGKGVDSHCFILVAGICAQSVHLFVSSNIPSDETVAGRDQNHSTPSVEDSPLFPPALPGRPSGGGGAGGGGEPGGGGGGGGEGGGGQR